MKKLLFFLFLCLTLSCNTDELTQPETQNFEKPKLTNFVHSDSFDNCTDNQWLTPFNTNTGQFHLNTTLEDINLFSETNGCSFIYISCNYNKNTKSITGLKSVFNKTFPVSFGTRMKYQQDYLYAHLTSTNKLIISVKFSAIHQMSSHGDNGDDINDIYSLHTSSWTEINRITRSKVIEIQL